MSAGSNCLLSGMRDDADDTQLVYQDCEALVCTNKRSPGCHKRSSKTGYASEEEKVKEARGQQIHGVIRSDLRAVMASELHQLRPGRRDSVLHLDSHHSEHTLLT